MPLYCIEKPATLAVSVADMKAHLRVDFDDDDDLIESYTEAVINHIDGGDGWLGRALIDQTWELRLDNWCFGRCLQIPLPPLIEVESIKYYDGDNALQTVSTADYRVIGVGGKRPARVELVSTASWPTVYSRSEAVIIRFRAGYLDTTESPAVANVPPAIVAAIKLLTANLYENRQTVVLGETLIEISAAENLLNRYRVYSH